MEPAKTIADMRMVGGHACLDFVNTVDSRRDRWGPDLLRIFADLIVWAERAGLVDAGETHELLAEASRRPALAEAALERAKVLREVLYEILHAEAEARPVPADALSVVRGAIAQALPCRELASDGNRLAWRWTDGSSLDAINHRIAFAAAEFMVAREDRRAIRECTGPNCGWLFLDTSRGGRRRWCSDETCGTHSRVRRFRMKAH